MYTKLAQSILTSTLWMEDDHTRLVWVAMLAMADKNGEVQASIPGLANVARVPIESCQAALNKFLSPDKFSRSTICDGRRIQAIKGGWYIINHDEYRKLASDEDRKQKAAERQARSRQRKREAVTPESRQISQAESESEANDLDKDKDVPAGLPVLYREMTQEKFDQLLKGWDYYALREDQPKLFEQLVKQGWRKKSTGELIGSLKAFLEPIELDQRRRSNIPEPAADASDVPF